MDSIEYKEAVQKDEEKYFEETLKYLEKFGINLSKKASHWSVRLDTLTINRFGSYLHCWVNGGDGLNKPLYFYLKGIRRFHEGLELAKLIEMRQEYTKYMKESVDVYKIEWLKSKIEEFTERINQLDV